MSTLIKAHAFGGRLPAVSRFRRQQLKQPRLEVVYFHFVGPDQTSCPK
jgi:hypothetical protein